MEMPSQKMNPVIPMAFINQIYTLPSPNMEAKKANMPMEHVKIIPATGTPRLLSFAKIRGACPSFAIEYNIRVDAYRLELPADNTAVKMTAFISEAAKATPAFSKMSVNGLTMTLSPCKLEFV